MSASRIALTAFLELLLRILGNWLIHQNVAAHNQSI